jgi:hypothetical protein
MPRWASSAAVAGVRQYGFAIDGSGNGHLNTTRASVDARLKFIGELFNIISTVGYAGLLLCVRTKIHGFA